MDFFNSPKRFVPGSKSRKINTFHLSPINVKVVSTGNAGKSLMVPLLLRLIILTRVIGNDD